tara:strand:- start:8559 stop:8804 length:246 start_codon:yes stop_codon:yes gene_type:complete
MDYEKLSEILRFSTPKSLLIVTWNNLLKELFCPFEVKVLKAVDNLKEGDRLWVQEIKVTAELKTVYIINDTAYYYYHFDIM